MKINGIEYGGQDQKGLTFKFNTANTLEEGDAVALSTTVAGNVDRGPANAPLYGKVSKIELKADLTPTGTVTVVRTGIINFKQTGALATGARNVSVDGNGNVVVNAAGKAVNVIGNGTVNTVDYVAVDLG